MCNTDTDHTGMVGFHHVDAVLCVLLILGGVLVRNHETVRSKV